ncbi:hypothetical protein [Vibrio maritimus]|uniref:hypothetical protein n=1 Tax=Vibrio maritimus TaxID=990268 RepID=UPI001F19B608|nr:hypothetical protein [Vibrio maritimus]
MTKALSSAVLGVLVMSQVHAAEVNITEVEQFIRQNCSISTAEQGLPSLSASCPIGHGIYQGMEPSSPEKNFFWVQCGADIHSMNESQLTRKVVEITENNVVQSYDGEYYRCLNGPYEAYKDAVQVNRYMSRLLGIEGFVRQVFLNEQLLKDGGGLQDNKGSGLSMVEPTLLNHTQVGGIVLFIPVYYDDKLSFYREANSFWNRMTLKDATKVCLSLDAELIKGEDIDLLEQHENAASWPSVIPFWTQSGNVRAFGGKTYTSTENSKFYIACRQPKG